MATSLDSMHAEQASQGSRKYDKKDVELAVRMGIKLIKDGGGLKVIADGINQSKDPARVVGQFLAQVMGKLAEQLRDQYGVDPGLFIAKNGWLDTILDWIESELGFPPDFSDKIYQQTLEVIKAAAMSPPPANDELGGQVVEAPAGPPDPTALPQQEAAPQQAGGY